MESQILRLPFKPWQQEAVSRMVQQKRFCVFDTVGVGKTIEAIGAIQLISNSKHTKAVVVVESPHVMQWREEFEKFSYLQVFSVTSGSKEKRREIYHRFFQSPKSSVLIINYGKLRYDFDSFRTGHIDVIVYDEALILSNRNETRQYACWLNQHIQYIYALTATPISRDIMQWFDLFECMGITPLQRDIFLQTFAEYTIDRIRTKKGTINKITVTGAKNISLLKRYYQPYYIRRRKKDIKKDSDRIEHIIHYQLFDLDKEQKVAYAKIKDGFIQIYRGEVENKELEPLSAYTTTLQVLDSAYLIDFRLPQTSPKIDGLVRTLEELGENKVFIYSRFKVFGQMIQDRLNQQEKDSAVFLHGDLDSVQLDRAKKEFINNPKVKYLVATDIAQRGLNLQVASTIIFMDLPMTPDAITQLIGRLDREGQESPFINIFFMLSDNSVEYNVFKLLKDRQKVFDEVLDEEGSRMFNITQEEFMKLL